MEETRKVQSLLQSRILTHHRTRAHVNAEEAILECECVAVDMDTGEMRPFQELMHRRRKYEVDKAVEDYPVSLFMFDPLFVDGKDLTFKPYPVRRRALENVVKLGDRVKVARSLPISDASWRSFSWRLLRTVVRVWCVNQSRKTRHTQLGREGGYG